MDKQTAERMSAFIIGLGVILAAATYLVSGPVAGRSAAIGAGLAVVNWYLLRFLVIRITRGSARAKAGMTALVMLKMGALMGLISLMVAAGWVQPIAFIVGMSALVGGLLFGSFLYIARSSGSER